MKHGEPGAPGRVVRWGEGRAGLRGLRLRPHLLAPDVQDMSLVTLSTRTPRGFFSEHQLLLHVAKSEMDKVRVFQADRELSWAVISMLPSRPCCGCSPFPPVLANIS